MIEKLRAWFPRKKKKEQSESPKPLVVRTPEDERERFFANLSHEIRTPVNGIVGFTQLLKETKLSGEQNELVNTIHSSSMHLLSLVSDILDFSKINANKLEFESIPFDLFRQVEDTVEVYAALSQKKRIELNVFIDPTITPMLIGDPTKLSQVIGNLVSNAIKFTEALGEVNVTVEKIHEDPKVINLEFSVKDTGIGIETQDQEKIFDAFVQANSSISREFGGTGLGLAISSKIVKYMGGELKLYSSFGVGSEFSFVLSFEKTRAKERKLYHDLYMGLEVGLLLPIIGSQKVVDSNLRKNIEYLGARFTTFYGNEILSLKKERYPDILFVEQQRNRADLEALSDLGIKIVLITILNAQEKPEVEAQYICKNLYKPLNLAKTIRALEVCTDDKHALSESAMEINKNFHGLRALIVDDNEINQKLLVKLLSDMQMDTEVASNGIEAIEFYKNIAFDIVLMDIEMPIMGGVEATQNILAYEREQGIAHTPLIALTGNVSTGDVQYYKVSGMDSAISKPIDVEVLIAHLNKYALGKNLVQHMEKGEQQLSGAKALIIEDNAIDQNLIERALASRGVESVAVVTGAGILDVYQSTPFDILFINASTPVMNAAETTKNIRTFESSTSMPSVPIVVMLSAESEEMHFNIYQEMGADGYLLKPLEIDEIKFQLDQYITQEEEIAEASSGTEDTVEEEPIEAVPDAAVILPPKEESIEEETAEEERVEDAEEYEGTEPVEEAASETEEEVAIASEESEETMVSASPEALEEELFGAEEESPSVEESVSPEETAVSEEVEMLENREYSEVSEEPAAPEEEAAIEEPNTVEVEVPEALAETFDTTEEPIFQPDESEVAEEEQETERLEIQKSEKVEEAEVTPEPEEEVEEQAEAAVASDESEVIEEKEDSAELEIQESKEEVEETVASEVSEAAELSEEVTSPESPEMIEILEASEDLEVPVTEEVAEAMAEQAEEAEDTPEEEEKEVLPEKKPSQYNITYIDIPLSK